MMDFLKRLLCLSGLCLILLAGLVGCGSKTKGTATVQGTVTVDGVLAESGNVVFHPSGDASTAYGSIRGDGTFALRIGQGNQSDPDYSKIAPGDYIATVMIRGPSIPDQQLGESVPPKAGPRISSSKYSNKETSGLSFTIKPGLNVINIEVEPASEEELTAEMPTDDPNAAKAEGQPASEEDAAAEPVESAGESAPAEVEDHRAEEASP